MNGTTIGEVNINLRMSLAQFRQDVKEGSDAAASGTKDMADAMKTNTAEARGSLMLLSEEVGVHIPRHLQRFIAGLPGVGTALNAAFSSVAVIAMIEVVIKIIEKIQEFKKAQEEAAAAGDKVRESMQRTDVEGRAALDALQQKFVEITQGPLAAMEYGLNHMSEQLQALKLSDEIDKGFADMEKSVKGSMLMFGSGEGSKKLTEFKQKLDGILKTQGRPAALEAIDNELVSINKEIEDTKANTGGQLGNNIVRSLEKDVVVLQAMQQRVDQSLTQSAMKRRNDEHAAADLRVKEELDSSNKIIAARNKEYEELKTLSNETEGLLDKHLSAEQKEIIKLNEATDKWTAYKVAWESAHKGISAVANANIERLTKEIDALKASADQAVDMALKAAATANLTKNPLPDFHDQNPLYGGTKEAQDLLKLETDQNAALEAGRQVYTQTRTAAEQYAETMTKLNLLLSQGAIDQDTYNRAAAAAAEKSNKLSVDAHKLGADIATTIEQAALFGRSWTDAFKAIAIKLTELILQMTLFKSLTTTASGGGGFFQSLLSGFGGMKAAGGPVDGSHFYVVGENGPELFAPGASGAIIPNSSLSSGSSGEHQRPIEFHMHVNGVHDVDGFKSSETQIAADMAALLGAAHRRIR